MKPWLDVRTTHPNIGLEFFTLKFFKFLDHFFNHLINFIISLELNNYLNIVGLLFQMVANRRIRLKCN